MEIVSTIAAAIAAIAALITVGLSRRTVNDTKAMRADTARARLRARLEEADKWLLAMGGSALEGNESWMSMPYMLDRALVGLEGMPACRSVVEATTTEEVAKTTMAARIEVDARLRELDAADARFAQS